MKAKIVNEFEFIIHIYARGPIERYDPLYLSKWPIGTSLLTPAENYPLNKATMEATKHEIGRSIEDLLKELQEVTTNEKYRTIVEHFMKEENESKD